MIYYRPAYNDDYLCFNKSHCHEVWQGLNNRIWIHGAGAYWSKQSIKEELISKIPWEFIK